MADGQGADHERVFTKKLHRKNRRRNKRETVALEMMYDTGEPIVAEGNKATINNERFASVTLLGLMRDGFVIPASGKHIDERLWPYVISEAGKRQVDRLRREGGKS